MSTNYVTEEIAEGTRGELFHPQGIINAGSSGFISKFARKRMAGSAKDASITRFPVALQAVDPSISSVLPIPTRIHDGMIDLLVERRRT